MPRQDTGPYFIKDAREEDSYERSHGGYPRQLKKLPRVPTGGSSPRQVNGRAEIRPLDKEVSDLAKRLVAEETRGFHCLAISVEDGFGMTWSAEATARAISSVAPRMAITPLAGELNSQGFPEIEHLVPWRRIARLAQQTGVLTSARLLPRHLTALITVGALVLGAAASYLTTLNKEATASALTVRFAVVALLVAALGLGGKYLAEGLPKLDTQNKTWNALHTDLRTAAESKLAEYPALVEALALELVERADHRALVVDDFGALDQLTRDTLDLYLTHSALEQSKVDRAELWVVFHSSDDKALVKDVLTARRGAPKALLRTSLYELQNLTSQQREELAKDCDHPERKTWRAVRAIVNDYSSLKDLDTLIDALQKRRGRPEAAQTTSLLHVLYLFALGSSVGAAPPLDERETLRGLGEQKKHRSRLLRTLLPGAKLSQDVLGMKIAELMSELPSIVEVQPFRSRRAFWVVPEVGRRLEERASELELPPPGLVHLYWAAYWADKRLNDRHLDATERAQWAREVSRHLMHSDYPASLHEVRPRWTDEQIGSFQQAQFDLHISLVRDNLALCRMNEVPPLLERSVALTRADDHDVHQRLLRRLRPCCWEAYVLSGDDHVLRTLVRVESELSPEEEWTAPSRMQSLAALFFESLPALDVDARVFVDEEHLGSPDQRSLAGFSRFRGAWLLGSLEPVITSVAPQLSALSESAPHAVLDEVQELVATVGRDTSGDGSTIDLATLVLGLWSVALLTNPFRPGLPSTLVFTRYAQRTAAVDRLESGFRCVLDISRARREGKTQQLNLVLDVLAEEAMITLLAAAIVLYTGTPDDPLNDKLRGLISDSAAELHLAWASLDWSGTMPARHELLRDVERYMLLVQVAWRSLGFDQLAALLSIRQAQFVSLTHRPDQKVASRVIDLVSGDLGHDSHIAILGQLVAAEAAQVSHHLQAQLVLRAATGALDLNLGENFTRELCALCIWHGHSFFVDLERPVALLAGPTADGERTSLEALLDGMPDECFGTLCLCLCNALRTERMSGYRPGVLDALKAHEEKVVPEITMRVDQEFSLFELQVNSANGRPDPQKVLEQWQPWQDSPLYAFLLHLLFVNDPDERSLDRLRAESLRVLSDPTTYDRYTGFVILAMDLIEAGLRKGKKGLTPEAVTALHALEDSIDHWEVQLPARSNIRAFTYLNAFSTRTEARYAARLAKWHEIDLEAYGVERLPDLVSEGSFFLIFWYYYSVFAGYGLDSEPRVSAAGLSSEEIERELKAWKKRDALPEPLVGGMAGRPSASMLSGDFLSLGCALFNLTEEQRTRLRLSPEALGEARAEMHRSARHTMRDLYAMIRALRGLPRSLDQVLTRHEEILAERAIR